jgi:hypothetical protein
MKSKLRAILSLLLIFGLDGMVLAEKINSGNPPAFNTDGVSVSNQQRRRRRVRRKQRGRTAGTYGIKATPREMTPPPPPPPSPPDAEPATSAAPAEEMPMTGGAPAPDPMDAAGSGRAPAKKSAPRIKPPTVKIKPPTE